MDIFEAMSARHAVRAYEDRLIEQGKKDELEREISVCNDESALNLQLVTGEPTAFGGSFLARLSGFKNVKSYIALVCGEGGDAEEKAGYYGERVVLKAQMLGLNTCWVGATFSKKKAAKHLNIGGGERLICVIALGYGMNGGKPHKSRPTESLCDMPEDAPEWFRRGMDAAALAPTALNQQKFYFTLSSGKVKAEEGRGVYTRLDLGIAKYHFELGADRKNFDWE